MQSAWASLATLQGLPLERLNHPPDPLQPVRDSKALGTMTADELAALAVTCPHLAAKAANPLQEGLATILQTTDKDKDK